jgi:hypothetical protein
MGVTGTLPVDQAEVRAQIERLTASPLLSSSESLCKLLRYLAAHAVDRPGTMLKEYQIATEVFGRPADFDPRLDSTVRVQTGRLRAKLAEYYGGPGAGDRLLVEIPKGSYALTFQPKQLPAPELDPSPAPAAPDLDPASPPERPVRVERQRNLLLWTLAAVSVILAATLSWTLLRPANNPSTAKVDAAPPPLREFWLPFLTGNDRPLVVFSNAEFVGRPETGLRYFRPQADKREQILDHYTGVGEVLAVHELDQVFNSLGQSIRVKRGRLLSLDDAKQSDLIFIGSPSENLSLREIPTTQDFVFRVIPDGPRAGDLAIFNLRIQKEHAEESRYSASQHPPLTEDHAIIAFEPGLSAGKRSLILAGTTTIGTQAAVEFVCRPASLRQLLDRVPKGANGWPSPFEAVIRVRVSGGVPVGSQLVAVHLVGN